MVHARRGKEKGNGISRNKWEIRGNARSIEWVISINLDRESSSEKKVLELDSRSHSLPSGCGEYNPGRRYYYYA